MAITDELREYAEMVPRLTSDLTAIADRIDEQHQKACDDAWDNGYEADYLGIENWLIEHQQVMEHHGYIELPKDVNGELVDIGDLVDEMLPFGGYAKPAHVDTMELYRSANGYGWMVKLDAENRALISPKLLRHHKQPTVEDVLEELLREYDRDDSELTNGEIIERFAAKLRLAESEES